MRNRTALHLSIWMAGAAPALAQTLPPLAVSDGILPGERRAHALAEAGDLDGDGTLDLWVGSPFDSSTALQAGAVRAVSGKTGTILMTLYGAAAVDHFGWALASLGDVNGDGVSDLAVGSPDSDQQSMDGGSVQVISGQSGATLLTVASVWPGARLGYSVSPAGDYNGDGRADFCSGAPFDCSAGNSAGSVEVRSGLNGALLARALGANAADRLGIAVATVGDLNGDGRAEVLAGADQDGVGPGYARVLSGILPQTLFTLVGADQGGRFGAAVAGGADVNGDGVPDFAIGASAALVAGLPCGSARIFSGASAQLLFEAAGTGSGEAFGSALAFLPDLDGDGHADLAVGALFEGGSGGAAGIVRAISSHSHRALAAWRGRSGGDRFGSALLLVQDRDADGLADLVVGAPKDDAGGIDSGCALTHSTRGAAPVAYCTGKLNSQGCLPRMRASGYASSAGAGTLDLRVESVLNNKVGILFFGRARAALPFQGGTLCITPPIQRSAALQSGGQSGASNCSGVLLLRIDAAWIQGHNWLVGQRIDAQAWYRDPQHPDGTSSGLSDALEFTVWL